MQATSLSLHRPCTQKCQQGKKWSPGEATTSAAQGYAYILTHPGTPCIFLDHLWTDGMLKPSLWRRLRSLLQVMPSSPDLTHA